MRNNIIALPAGRIRRNSPIHRRKKDLDQDLFVNMVESDPGHIARREARRDAYLAALQTERAKADGLNELLATATFISMAGGTLAVALALVL